MPRKPPDDHGLERDPFWYKNGVIYEVHVRAFCDSDGDGKGDFRGLTEKLEYLQDLGVTAVWLLPFYPSPLRDDGYDIADYYEVHPDYGTLSDFKALLREAHRLGLRVITELVVNHTSDQHPWFQRSRRARPGSRWRDFYVWHDTPDKYKDARIIFKDFEASNWTWDPLAQAYYWHRFYAHQPDLNFDNPRVHKEILRVLDFWLDLGVDGLRLDAIPYLYEREGTNCENLPETHAFLKELRRHVDERYLERMLLAEANQWPEDAVAYFGSGRGDECHMSFHFPLMPRLFMAIRMEDRVPIVDILEQTPPIPETSQWALFLRNHDELTLEMVTDEERDYMYRMYARDTRARINLGIRRRLAPLLGNDRKRIELLNGLLFSLPGTPVLYYGDEIGMGDNIFLGDRNGVRTPMQWSADRNAGFSKASPQSLYLPVNLDPENHYEAVNVDVQQRNPHSLLWWMKRMMALRKRWKALGGGSLEFLHPDNRKILAFVRRRADERILVVANLSRFVQPVELDLSAFKEMVPIELFGRNEFPRIDGAPYFLTLSPHAFFWFSLESRVAAPTALAPLTTELQALPALNVSDGWEEVVAEEARGGLEGILPNYLASRRWFGSKAAGIKTVTVQEVITLEGESGNSLITLLLVEFLQADPQTYLLPLAFACGSEAESLLRTSPQLAIARLKVAAQRDEGILYDAIGSKAFGSTLLDYIWRRRSAKGLRGELAAFHTPAFRRLRGDALAPPDPSPVKAEQTNSAILYGDRLILKLFRRLEPGINPDLEIGRFLTEKEFKHSVPLGGALEYRTEAKESMTLAVLSGFVLGSKDAWDYTLDALGRYYERVQSLQTTYPSPPRLEGSLLSLAASDTPQAIQEIVGTYLESARLLGERTADLHAVLTSNNEQPEFAPEPFTPHYQRSLFQSMRNLARQNLQLLRKRWKDLPGSAGQDAQRVLAVETQILDRFRSVCSRPIAATRTRDHGDFHLGQVLHTGKDFVIIDFEGEPARSLGERRLKRSPLRDVAGMLRSFHYAAHAGLLQQMERGGIPQARLDPFQPWAHFWQLWVSVTYLRTYLSTARHASFLPKSEAEVRILLDAFLIEKAIYELGYELNHRPDWVAIPLQGILQLVESQTH
ncbi:MAG: maltose alpha-D-glucosyltransferase [Verrucomicrobia bacterium]|nr:maltose alpha-D-glucosyltransferase [Verrucomicrobiota bacterium]